MKNKRSLSFVSILILFLTFSCSDMESKFNGVLVKDISEFNDAVKNANPGDISTIPNGIYFLKLSNGSSIDNSRKIIISH